MLGRRTDLGDTMGGFAGLKPLLKQRTGFYLHMNYFRLIADMLHLFSFFVLIWKIRTNRSCAGISLKTQILYAVVFVSRYMDLLWNWHSTYLVIMKLIFISSTFYIIYLIAFQYRHKYDKKNDQLPTYYLIIPCIVLALIAHQRFTFWEVLWAFSIYLEAVAIIPQLMLLTKTGSVDTITSHYVFCLGGYRALYILNWIWRFFTEPNYSQWIVWIAGLVQTGLYCDFFYHYVLSVRQGTAMELPEINI
mmetsp:Transcript_14751/g.16372  ORF Transcript_14751/g.16372 Transcript_14751/m.16372 type:complete len:248 (+) Transcript_14751:40-783(+)